MLSFDVVQQPTGDYQLQFTVGEGVYVYLEVGVTWTDLETIQALIDKALEEGR